MEIIELSTKSKPYRRRHRLLLEMLGIWDQLHFLSRLHHKLIWTKECTS